MRYYGCKSMFVAEFITSYIGVAGLGLTSSGSDITRTVFQQFLKKKQTAVILRT